MYGTVGDAKHSGESKQTHRSGNKSHESQKVSGMLYGPDLSQLPLFTGRKFHLHRQSPSPSPNTRRHAISSPSMSPSSPTNRHIIQPTLQVHILRRDLSQTRPQLAILIPRRRVRRLQREDPPLQHRVPHRVPLDRDANHRVGSRRALVVHQVQLVTEHGELLLQVAHVTAVTGIHVRDAGEEVDRRVHLALRGGGAGAFGRDLGDGDGGRCGCAGGRLGRGCISGQQILRGPLVGPSRPSLYNRGGRRLLLLGWGGCLLLLLGGRACHLLLLFLLHPGNLPREHDPI